MSRLRSTTCVPTVQVHRQSIEILQERLPFKFKGASCQVVEIGISPERSRNVRTSQYYATSILANFERNTKLLQEVGSLVERAYLYVAGMKLGADK